jgi:nitrogen fixation/metabolism regulation signal transduction histidine kinase
VSGSRLAARLVLLFVLAARLPGVLVYAVSAQPLAAALKLVRRQRDRALDGGINLGRSSLDYLLKETGNARS